MVETELAVEEEKAAEQRAMVEEGLRAAEEARVAEAERNEKELAQKTQEWLDGVIEGKMTLGDVKAAGEALVHTQQSGVRAGSDAGGDNAGSSEGGREDNRDGQSTGVIATSVRRVSPTTVSSDSEVSVMETARPAAVARKVLPVVEVRVPQRRKREQSTYPVVGKVSPSFHLSIDMLTNYHC